MATYKDLIKQREQLEQQISAARQRELSDAVGRVRSLIQEFELTKEDVFPSQKAAGKQSAAKGSKVAPKYQDPGSGATWTGRGKAPRWIVGDKEQFAIK